MSPQGVHAEIRLAPKIRLLPVPQTAPIQKGKAMSRPTIAQLTIENETLRKRIADLEGINLGQQRENSNLKTEIYDGMDRERKLREQLMAERKEVVWFRRRLNESRDAADRLMARIVCTIDCVGRPGGECEPMSQKLHLYVGTIIAKAIQIPASEIRSMVNLENIEAHKHVRKESELPPVEPDGF